MQHGRGFCRGKKICHSTGPRLRDVGRGIYVVVLGTLARWHPGILRTMRTVVGEFQVRGVATRTHVLERSGICWSFCGWGPLPFPCYRATMDRDIRATYISIGPVFEAVPLY